MKRNGLRTVVVLALTIFLLNAPVCATASRLQDTCAEARDEVALRPEWMRILLIRFLYVRFLFLVHTIAVVSKEGIC